MKLHEIPDAIEWILANKVDHETGEVTDETLAELDALEMDREALLLALAAYAKGELAEAEAVKAEAKKLDARAKGHTNRAARLHEYVAQYMPADLPKLSDARSVIQWRKNPPAVEVFGVVPEAYRRQPAMPPWEPDKVKILADLKAGVDVDGAKIVQKRRLVIT